MGVRAVIAGFGVGGVALLGGLSVPAAAWADSCCPTSAAAAPATSSGGGALAFTGSDTTRTLALGAAALGLGTGLLVASRRGGLRPAGMTLAGAGIVAAAAIPVLWVGSASAATLTTSSGPLQAAATCCAPSSGGGAAPATGTAPGGSQPGGSLPGGGGPTGGGPTGGGGSAPAVLPESPVVALLPVAGVAAAGAIVVRRQRRAG